MKLRLIPLAIAVAAGLAVGGGVAVLYGMIAKPVHAPPAALAKLRLEDKPIAVPAVAFSDAAGARHMLAEFKGHYVLLNLWATWCAPCVRELPALARLAGADPGLKIVAVNVGRSSVADTASFLAAHQAKALTVYVDSNVALERAFGAYGLPLSVLIDPKGEEVARAVGPAEWDAPEAIAYFKSLPKEE